MIINSITGDCFREEAIATAYEGSASWTIHFAGAGGAGELSRPQGEVVVENWPTFKMTLLHKGFLELPDTLRRGTALSVLINPNHILAIIYKDNGVAIHLPTETIHVHPRDLAIRVMRQIFRKWDLPDNPDWNVK